VPEYGRVNTTQLEKVGSGRGFFAALDQSGGSTPKALEEYGVGQDRYSSDAEMFDLVHAMRTRVLTSPAFDGTRVLAAILFEQTMERDVDGVPTARYLWDEKNVVPFLKVDKGLAAEQNGVRLMKPIDTLDDLLERANRQQIFGTKMRSVINDADEAGIAAIVDQQFDYASQIMAAGLVPIIEPEVSISSPHKEQAETLLRDAIAKRVAALPGTALIMLKITIPSRPGLYGELAADPRVLRIVALSGGYRRDEACALLARDPTLIASFSRALLEGLSDRQNDMAFNAQLESSIEQIYQASVTKQSAGSLMRQAAMRAAGHPDAAGRPSPLAGMVYPTTLSLLHFAEVPADEAIDEFVDQFAACSRVERWRQRSALTTGDIHTVLIYARRAAIRTLRSGDQSAARRGVAALAIVNSERDDIALRDVAWQAGFLSYAIGRASGDAAGAFRASASMAVGDTAGLLSRQARQPVANLGEWGFREVRTSGGIGLVQDRGQPYQPESDLLSLADVVAAGMDGDTWRLGEPETGTQLDAGWLAAARRRPVELALGSITGCVALRGGLASQDSPSARAQHMVVFLAEAGTGSAAQTIARAAGPRTGSSFAAVASAAGQLCAVVTARSVVKDIPSVETRASLERFRRVLADALGGQAS